MEPAETMEVTGKSQPFVRVLEMIRAHRSGSLFERRLEIQVLISCRSRGIFGFSLIFKFCSMILKS